MKDDTMRPVLFAEFTAREGHTETVRELITGLAANVHTEPGNVAFTVHTRADEPRRFVVYEVYRDDAAFQEHISAEYGAVFNAAIVNHIEEPATRLTWLHDVG